MDSAQRPQGGPGQLFTRRERMVILAIVAVMMTLSVLRVLDAKRVIGLFEKGRIVRSVEGEPRR